MIAFALVRIATAALLFWALADHRYGYYQFLRLVVTAVAGYSAYAGFTHGGALQRTVGWIFAGCAILFNPIAPIYLNRSTWAVIDVGVGVLFLVSLLLLREPAAEIAHKAAGARWRGKEAMRARRREKTPAKDPSLD